METRRVSGVVPRVRHVGFFTPNAPPQTTGPPGRAQSAPLGSNSPPLSNSPASNSLSPVMIPPSRHLSENLALRTAAVPVPGRARAGDHMVVGSYNPSDLVLDLESPSSRTCDGEFSEEAESSVGWYRRSNSAKFASSFPSGGFDLSSMKQPDNVGAVDGKKSIREPEKQIHKEPPSSSTPQKAKLTKAERRAKQESERAAKAAAKEAKTSAGGSGAAGKPQKQPSLKKDVPSVVPSVAASEKKGLDRTADKERKKDVPPPRLQFDDKSRVEKAKRRSVVHQTEARNMVELFRHLPQYEHGTQLPDLEAKNFRLDPIHPAVYKVGLQYLAGEIAGGNARCIAMLLAFQDAIRDYSTSPEKTLNRDLTAKIGSYVSFLIECRPLSMSMGNAIRFLKSRIAKLPLTFSESEAKAALSSDIDRFINEKIVLADKVIARHAATKIRDGDVLLTYGLSCVVEMILLHAHELGKKFRIVVVDSRQLEAQKLLKRLVAKGLSCTYAHIVDVSYIMHEVTRVFLGASSVLANGTVYSRVGTAVVAMVANEFHVPVLVCCEAYKFHERVQLDSICFNELGDPNDIAKVPGRQDVKYFENWTDKENLQLLNLKYDATPLDYISMIVTEYGMIPTTSVPVIVREYRKEHLLMI